MTAQRRSLLRLGRGRSWAVQHHRQRFAARREQHSAVLYCVQALFDLEATNAELKADLRDLYITSAKEIDIPGTQRKAIIVHVSTQRQQHQQWDIDFAPRYMCHAPGRGIADPGCHPDISTKHSSIPLLLHEEGAVCRLGSCGL